MATNASGPFHGPVSGTHGTGTERWASRRRRYLDNLKVLMIAGIIAGHGVIGCWEFGGWDYGDLREVTLAPVTEVVLLVLLVLFALTVIPLLFLVAGLLAPVSLRRRGTAAFVRARLLRLGVPFAVFVVVLWPLVTYTSTHALTNAAGSCWRSSSAPGRAASTPARCGSSASC